MQTKFSGRWDASLLVVGLLLLQGCASNTSPISKPLGMSSLSGAPLTDAVPEMGLDAIVPAVVVATPTPPDWYLPGYRSIGQRLGDGQYVTCGDGYPCATPTPKEGVVATGYGYGDSTPFWGQAPLLAPKWKVH